jgi:hypothetical protein
MYVGLCVLCMCVCERESESVCGDNECMSTHAFTYIHTYAHTPYTDAHTHTHSPLPVFPCVSQSNGSVFPSCMNCARDFTPAVSLWECVCERVCA